MKLDARQPSGTPRRLSLAHFAFYRAYLEGPSAIDLPTLADTYLDSGRDPRRVRSLVRWLQDELAAAARRTGDRAAMRLLRLPKSLGQEDHSESRTPSLAEFREQVDPQEVFDEAELLALFREQYPEAQPSRQLRRGRSLHARRLDALRRLELSVAEAPALHHAISGWLEPTTAARLEAVGLTRLQQLIDAINSLGHRWFVKVPGIGAEGAGRVVRWIEANRATLGALSIRAIQPLRQVPRAALIAERVVASPFAPLELLDVPQALSGASGTNRAAQGRNQTGAQNDLAAIRAWLALHEPDSHTWRSYRTQAERLLLWAIVERGKPLSSLDVADITAYRTFLLAPPENWIGPRKTQRWSPHWRPFAGPLSPASRATACAVLKALFQWLVEMRYLDFNPWTGVKASAVEREAVRIKADHALTRAQCAYVLGHIERDAGDAIAERARFMFILGCSTGLRLAEISTATLGGLNTKWIDDEIGTAWTLDVVGKRSKARTIPIPRKTFAALQRYLRARGLPEDPTRSDPTTPLIGRVSGEDLRPLEPRSLALAFKLIFRRAAGALLLEDPHAAARLAKASTHWLRHTFGTRAIEAGTPLDIVQENLGHVSPATTSIYVTTELDRRIRALEEAF
ncbi:phage integrase family protein (plasmid) [Robbsia andropogonis]|uniref:phage integrase family protein n=1 Tax=Robbsia andropogonis TaxID=28092 RepID=UPI003D1E00CD